MFDEKGRWAELGTTPAEQTTDSCFSHHHGGPVLLAVDAVMHRSMADAASREMFVTDMDDETRIRTSTQKVADAAAQVLATLVVYGHDHEQWSSLRHAPDFYQ